MSQHAVIHAADAPPVLVPRGYVGPVELPGTGRRVYWTGRVAIGLRYQVAANHALLVSHSALFAQALLLPPPCTKGTP
jgi:hypothetical protein